jgi:hypothetical protein
VRRTFVVRNGKVVEGKGQNRPSELPIPGEGDPRGFSFQLPKNYKHATRYTKDGFPMWTTKSEAQDIAKRAADQGDSRLQWDKYGGMQSGKDPRKG